MTPPPAAMSPPDDAVVTFVKNLGQTDSLEDFQNLLRFFFQKHTGMAIRLGFPQPDFPHVFHFPGPDPGQSTAPFSEFHPEPPLLESLLVGALVPAPPELWPATHLIPIGFGKTLLALLACTDTTGQEISDKKVFIQRVAALAGLALNHLHTQKDLEKRKAALERKVFELALLEETTASLIADLEAPSIGKKILLSLAGYLTANPGLLYLKDPSQENVFIRMAENGIPDNAPPRTLFFSTRELPFPWPAHIQKHTSAPQALISLLCRMNMEVLFPMIDGDQLTGFAFFGKKARGDAFQDAELRLGAAMLRQALAPLRNAALFSDLKENHAALMTSLGRLREEIAERQRTEEKLLEYQGVVAASQDPVALIDKDLCFVMVNRACADAFDTQPEKLAGKNIALVTDPELFKRKLQNPLERCLAGETVRFRFAWSFPKWGLRHIDVAGYPYQGRNLKPQAIFILRDITQMKELENRLLQSQKMEAIGTLAGGIAHDFNNILSGILGYTELALSRLQKGCEAGAFMEKAIAACTRASDLVRQILSFSRGDSNNQDMRPLCMVEITEDALKLLRASLPPSLEIQFDHGPSPLPILGNPTQIHQVVMNLCTNAAYAMDNQGTIHIRLRPVHVDAAFASSDPSFRMGSYVELQVRDSGTGIPGEYLSRIFDPFFTTKPQGKGTGMGLSISHGIVGRHGGVIQVDSTPGKGSAFRIYLPMTSASTGAAPEQIIHACIRGTERILIVDDETELLNLAAEILSELGYAVTTASKADKALTLFMERPQDFDLAILDQVMPRMTGATLAQHLLAIRPDLPILLCSGFSEAVSPPILESMGIRSYLMKPFTRSQLAGAVRRLLD